MHQKILIVHPLWGCCIILFFSHQLLYIPLFFFQTEIAGQGYINIRLSHEEVAKKIADIMMHGVKPPSLAKKRVIVDFSSPNIAKEMHVGHLR